MKAKKEQKYDFVRLAVFSNEAPPLVLTKDVECCVLIRALAKKIGFLANTMIFQNIQNKKT